MYLLLFVTLIIGSPVAALFIAQWRSGDDANLRRSFLAGLAVSLAWILIAIYYWRHGLFLKA
ncbi:MAG: hypothetical protein EOO09_04135 [Chitinophagaceae bacterium]|nr:MAG: hypothetical protein EOO09_04135 [Chitinophagaceae bacterium]